MAEKYDMPILYSCHPRSKKRLEFSGFELDKRVIQHEPLGFHDYNCLQMNAFAVVSDSGTLPEESSFFTSVDHPFPAVCIRTSTERPESLDKAGFVLAGIDEICLLQAVDTAVELVKNITDVESGNSGKVYASFIGGKYCDMAIISRNNEFVEVEEYNVVNAGEGDEKVEYTEYHTLTLVTLYRVPEVVPHKYRLALYHIAQNVRRARVDVAEGEDDERGQTVEDVRQRRREADLRLRAVDTLKHGGDGI